MDTGASGYASGVVTCAAATDFTEHFLFPAPTESRVPPACVPTSARTALSRAAASAVLPARPISGSESPHDEPSRPHSPSLTVGASRHLLNERGKKVTNIGSSLPLVSLELVHIPDRHLSLSNSPFSPKRVSVAHLSSLIHEIKKRHH